MPTPRSLVSKSILETLGDNEWHLWEEILETAGAAVPPGEAIRIAERNRRYVSASKTRVANTDPGFQVRAGQRSKARDTLNALIRSNHVAKIENENGEKMVRIIKSEPVIIVVDGAIYSKTMVINADNISSVEEALDLHKKLSTLPHDDPGVAHALHWINSWIDIRKVQE